MILFKKVLILSSTAASSSSSVFKIRGYHPTPIQLARVSHATYLTAFNLKINNNCVYH